MDLPHKTSLSGRKAEKVGKMFPAVLAYTASCHKTLSSQCFLRNKRPVIRPPEDKSWDGKGYQTQEPASPSLDPFVTGGDLGWAEAASMITWLKVWDLSDPSSCWNCTAMSAKVCSTELLTLSHKSAQNGESALRGGGIPVGCSLYSHWRVGIRVYVPGGDKTHLSWVHWPSNEPLKPRNNEANNLDAFSQAEIQFILFFPLIFLPGLTFSSTCGEIACKARIRQGCLSLWPFFFNQSNMRWRRGDT